MLREMFSCTMKNTKKVKINKISKNLMSFPSIFRVPKVALTMSFMKTDKYHQSIHKYIVSLLQNMKCKCM